LPQRRAAADGVDAGEQFTDVVRLHDVVVRAEVEAVDPGPYVGPRGDHDHRGRAAAPDPAAHLEAVLVGQAEVQQDAVELRTAVGQQRLDSLLAATGVPDVEAVLAEYGGEGGGDPVVVLHEQQSHTPPHLPQVVQPVQPAQLVQVIQLVQVVKSPLRTGVRRHQVPVPPTESTPIGPGRVKGVPAHAPDRYRAGTRRSPRPVWVPYAGCAHTAPRRRATVA